MKEYIIKRNGETIATTTSKRKANTIMLSSLFAPGVTYDITETTTHKKGHTLTAYKNGRSYRTAVKVGDTCKVYYYYKGAVLPCCELCLSFNRITLQDLLNI